MGEYDQRNNIDCEQTESGRNLCAPPLQDMEIEQVIPHEEYDKTKSRENDIALIRLKKHAALGRKYAHFNFENFQAFNDLNKLIW